MRKTDIRSGQLQYSRRKTRQTLSIGWEPSMQAMLEEMAAAYGEPPSGTTSKMVNEDEHRPSGPRQSSLFDF